MGKELKSLDNQILILRDQFIKDQENGFRSISEFIKKSSFIEQKINYSFLNNLIVLSKLQYHKLFNKIKHCFNHNKLAFYDIKKDLSLLCEQVNTNESKIIFFIIKSNNISYYISEDEVYYFDNYNNFNVWEFDECNQIVKTSRRQKTIFDIPIYHKNSQNTFTKYYLNKKIIIDKNKIRSGDISAHVYNYQNKKTGVYLTLSEDPYSHDIEYFKNFEILNDFVEIIINDSNTFHFLTNIKQKLIDGCFQKPSFILSLDEIDKNIKMIKINTRV